MNTFIDFYLLFYFVIYYLLVFFWVSYRVKKKTGINPYVFRNSDSPHDYLGKVTKVITFFLFLVILLNLFAKEAYKYVIPIWYLENETIRMIGFVIINLSIIWILYAQLQMDKSWRIGIDQNATTELKTTGVFSLSRNPVFLGMTFSLLGSFLALANVVTFLVFVMAFVLFQLQIRLEEEYLQRKHGEKYMEYCKKVRRWI